MLLAATLIFHTALNYMSDNIEEFETVPLPPKIIKKIRLSEYYMCFFTCDSSDFEKVFIKYGLVEQAKLIKQKRIVQQSYASKYNFEK